MRSVIKMRLTEWSRKLIPKIWCRISKRRAIKLITVSYYLVRWKCRKSKRRTRKCRIYLLWKSTAYTVWTSEKSLCRSCIFHVFGSFTLSSSIQPFSVITGAMVIATEYWHVTLHNIGCYIWSTACAFVTFIKTLCYVHHNDIAYSGN